MYSDLFCIWSSKTKPVSKFILRTLVSHSLSHLHISVAQLLSLEHQTSPVQGTSRGQKITYFLYLSVSSMSAFSCYGFPTCKFLLQSMAPPDLSHLTLTHWLHTPVDERMKQVEMRTFTPWHKWGMAYVNRDTSVRTSTVRVSFTSELFTYHCASH